MFKKLIQFILHLIFFISRPLTVGVRGICFDTNKNKVLLVKHTYLNEWALPGGGVEVGESMKDGLKRELLEEVGILCEEESLIGIFQNKSISKRDHVVIYLIDNWTENNKYKKPKFEISNVKWYPVNNLPKNITPCTSYALKKYFQSLNQISKIN